MNESTGTERILDGTVVRSTGSWYEVRAADSIISCRIRGKFRLDGPDQSNPVVVGDRVSVRTQTDGTGLIVGIQDRVNCIARRAAGRKIGKQHVIVANIDYAWIVQSVLFPKINPGFIDRFIAMANYYDIPVGIIVNKMDLLDDSFREAVDYWVDLYSGLNYDVLRTSVETGEGTEKLASRLKGKTTAVIGPSGVGKSSLLNHIEPSLDLRIGDISVKTQKGTHTTTFAALHPLSFGGFVVDTPGLREYGLIDIEPDMLSHMFVEFVPIQRDCRFPNCSHDHEPGCAIKDAVSTGQISEDRYQSYLNMLYSLQQGEKDVGR